MSINVSEQQPKANDQVYTGADTRASLRSHHTQ